MVSDKIRFSNGGAGIVEALAQAEKTAAFRELEKREALHLRLFAEEMLGMARSLTGEREGDFWIESEGRRFCLHLKVITPMNAEKRKNLLAASTSGKNAAAVGFMGKIRDLFERSFEAPGGAYLSPVESAGPFALSVPFGPENAPGVWTLSTYRHELRQAETEGDRWDELERSVISRLADEVKIAIGGGEVEMTVEKTF